MNACFDFLDRAVIEGRADEPALRDPEISHARLLEDVAAVAGVLRAVGVGPAARVGVTTSDDLKAVVTALAVLRLGAVPVGGDEAVTMADRDGAAQLVWGEDSGLDWTGVIKAGRTDPAAAYETPDGEAGGPELRELPTPVTVGELRALVAGQ